MSAALFYLQLALASMGLADAPESPPPAAEETPASTPPRANTSTNASGGHSPDQAADSEIYNGF